MKFDRKFVFWGPKDLEDKIHRILESQRFGFENKSRLCRAAVTEFVMKRIYALDKYLNRQNIRNKHGK